MICNSIFVTVITFTSSTLFLFATSVDVECPSNFVGNIRNPENCSTYIACTAGGTPMLMPCPDNLCYLEEKDWCDWCYLVPDCLQCPSGENIKRPVFVEYSQDCTHFYMCRQDGNFGGLGVCAEGLWFHADKQACDVPWAQTCKPEEAK